LGYVRGDEAREDSKNSARLRRHDDGIGRCNNSSDKFLLESNRLSDMRAAFRRSISEFESAVAYEQWRIAYAKTIVPISATLAGSTLALAWWMALVQSMVVIP